MQGVFPFIQDEPAWPKRSERLFFGLLLAIDAGRRVGRFARQFRHDNHLTLRLLAEQRLHISLHLVGDFCRLPEKFIFAARRAAKMVALPPIDMTLDAIKSFGGPASKDGKPREHPVVLLGEEDGLCDLHHSLGGAMRKNGLRAGNRFTPHLTLSHSSSVIARQAIEPIHLRISDFVLIHSELGRTRYNVLGRWPLRG
jgi:2'-5' RNA ligase